MATTPTAEQLSIMNREGINYDWRNPDAAMSQLAKVQSQQTAKTVQPVSQPVSQPVTQTKTTAPASTNIVTAEQIRNGYNPAPAQTTPVSQPAAKQTALTPEQVKQYYAEQGNATNPLSPLAWLEKQTKTATPAAPTPPIAPVSQTTPTGNQTPEFKVPEAPTAVSNYVQSATTNLDATTKALTEARDKQIADLQTKMDAAKAEYDSARQSELSGIQSMGAETAQEKQAKLDYLSEEKKRFDENYTKVQGLAGELQTLLTNGTTAIENAKSVTGLASIRNPRIAKTKEDIAARAGVLEAVISVYNGQMSQAQNQLTTATNVLTSAYSDQIDYWKTVVNFYESKAGTANEQLGNLTSTQRKYIDAKITTLENDRQIAQANLENLKSAMTDPDTAMAYAASGVSLTDSPEQINAKLANYAYSVEKSDLSNKMASSGYSAVIPGQKAPSDAEVVTVTDSKGIQKQYYKAPDPTDQWGEPYLLGGDYVQKNKATGELRTAVNVPASDTGVTTTSKNELINEVKAQVVMMNKGGDYEGYSDEDKATILKGTYPELSYDEILNIVKNPNQQNTQNVTSQQVNKSSATPWNDAVYNTLFKTSSWSK